MDLSITQHGASADKTHGSVRWFIYRLEQHIDWGKNNIQRTTGRFDLAYTSAFLCIWNVLKRFGAMESDEKCLSVFAVMRKRTEPNTSRLIESRSKARFSAVFMVLIRSLISIASIIRQMIWNWWYQTRFLCFCYVIRYMTFKNLDKLLIIHEPINQSWTVIKIYRWVINSFLKNDIRHTSDESQNSFDIINLKYILSIVFAKLIIIYGLLVYMY